MSKQTELAQVADTITVNSGNVGIGTSSPSAKLSVTGLAMNSASSGVELEGSWPWLKFKDTEANQDSWLQYVDASSFIIKQIDYDDRNSAPSTVGSERMRIDSSGNLLVGTTGAFTSGGGNSGGDGAVMIARDSERCLFLKRASSNGTLVEFIRGGITSPVGSISITTSATSYNTSSDYRLKENVVELTGATDRLKQLEPKRFNFIVDDTTTVDGFLAHEVQNIVPEAVHGEHNEVDADGNPVYQGIDQSKLVPLLVATIKELEARITALENA